MESSTALNSYTPLDLSCIPVSSIQSERELEAEIIKICEILKDNCKNQDFRIEIWKSL